MNDNDPYPSPTMRLTAIRLVKAAPGKRGLPVVTFESGGVAMRLLQGGPFEEESESDYIFFIEHEVCDAASPVSFRVEWLGAVVRHVLSERKRLEFSREGDTIRFALDLNGLTGRSLTLDVHSRWSGPGLDIRVEHNDRLRSSGRFNGIPWPQRQIDAATHYIFAARELLGGLGIPAMLAERKLGYVALMGFETCNPYHDDFPPHWHLIYRWEHTAGSQAPHLYMDETGRNILNKVTVDGIPRVKGNYEADEWCLFKDAFGRDAFALQVCRDGGVAVAKPGSAVWRLTPYDPRNGVDVYAGDAKAGTVRVANEPAAGAMRIRWSSAGAAVPVAPSYEEIVDYEPLLGDIVRVERKPAAD